MTSEKPRGMTTCAWCGHSIELGSRGPIPTWCSSSCRHRAWEQRRAAASGRSAVEVVDRRIEVPVPLAPSRRDWPRVLEDLAAQLDGGKIYDRDLQPLAAALSSVLDAFERRWTVTDPRYRRPR